MPLSVGSSMRRLGLAVAAALAAAVVATVVFDGGERERASEQATPAAATDSARPPAVHDRVPAASSGAFADAPGLDPALSTETLDDVTGIDAAADAVMAEVPPQDAPAPSPPGPERDTAVVTPPLAPPAGFAPDTEQRAPASQPATAQDAIRDADDSESDAEQARRLNREGIALIDAGRPRQAIAPLERAAALQPRDAEILDNLGYAYLLAGEHLVASRHFMRALDVAPTRSATWINLGHASAELGQRERAVHAVVKGYHYSTHKATVRATLLTAAMGSQYSPQWREVARLALARIDAG